MKEEFSRTALLIGEENINQLKTAHIAVFGLGGATGLVPDTLARCGIENFTIIDGDTYSITNINRQIMATMKTVGLKKTDVIKNHLLDINPDICVDIIDKFLMPKDIEEMDFKAFDYVVDGIDTVSTKLAIIKRCDDLDIPIISVMGTGNKLDPSKLIITDIYKTEMDPLAKVIRSELRKLNIKHLKVCFSNEVPKKIVADTTNSSHHPASISFVPPVAGFLVASEIIKDLIAKGNNKNEK